MDPNLKKEVLNGIAEQFRGKSASCITHLLHEMSDEKTMYDGLKCLACEEVQKIIHKMNKKCAIWAVVAFLAGVGADRLINVMCNKEKSRSPKNAVTATPQ